MSDYKNYLDSNDPMSALESWYNQALKEEENPYYFTLSTVGLDGDVNARTLLLKRIVDGKLLFFTNYNSVKAKEIENNNKVAMTFYWNKLGKQVRVKGTAVKCDPSVSKEYFHSRAFESQVASFISDQSSPVGDREVLEREYKTAIDKYQGGEVPYPENWGGYLVDPSEITFFIYGDFRLNDRFQFKKNELGEWEDLRLYP